MSFESLRAIAGPTAAGLAIAGLLSGCASLPTPVTSYKAPAPPRGIVLVVDGAGGYQEASKAVAAAVEKSGMPLDVHSFVWTHGRGRGVADMTDVDHARAQGRRLAQQVACHRAQCPNLPIHVLAYSAGTHVALEAAHWLEPDSVERIVLLAPAVSADYDLRPALRAARQGVDAFTSEQDRLYLGLGTRIVGTADGKRGVPPAGRVGFDMPPLAGADAALAMRFRQHPWDPSVAWTTNVGDHPGSLRSAYLRAYVLPLFASSR
ncbi:MAG: lysophospholipase [Gemmataceae bacterium]|nr:lysophospholipase [Gemmataceae bacterium]